MRTSQRVSIWLGDFDDDVEFDDYLGVGFAADFGFEILSADGPECAVQEPSDISTLEL